MLDRCQSLHLDRVRFVRRVMLSELQRKSKKRKKKKQVRMR